MSAHVAMSAPLRRRTFRLLFAGQLVSNLGDWLDFLALSVLIAYVWHKGAASLAALPIVIAIPWVFLSPVAGVLVDRWPKRTVMVGADLGRAVVVLGLVVAPNLPVLLVLVLLKTALSTMFAPSQAATVRATVPEEELHAANSISQLVGQSTKVLGPALGGVLVGLWGPRVAFVVDAATFLASAAVLSRLDSRQIESTLSRARIEIGAEGAGEGFWSQLREGFAYIATRRALLICLVGSGLSLFLIFGFDSLAALAFRELGVGRSLFGVAVAGIGLGGALGTVVVGRWAGEMNPFALMGSGMLVIGALIVLMGLALLTGTHGPAVIWTPVLIGVGIASAGVLVASPTIMQRETPAGLMGRVSTAAIALPTVCQLFAPVVSAAIAHWQSVGFVFALEGGALAVLGASLVAIRPAVGVGVPRVAPIVEEPPIAPREGSVVLSTAAFVTPN